MSLLKFEIVKADFLSERGVRLYRIRHLRTGLLGGYIEDEWNLSHTGRSWIHGDAWVYGKAQILGDAQVAGSCKIFESARVTDQAQVYDAAEVFGNARIEDHARVFGQAQVMGDVIATDRVRVSGVAYVSGELVLDGDQEVTEKLAPAEISKVTQIGLTRSIPNLNTREDHSLGEIN